MVAQECLCQRTLSLKFDDDEEEDEDKEGWPARRMILQRRLLSTDVRDYLELVGGLCISTRSAQGSVMRDAKNLDKRAFVFIDP